MSSPASTPPAADAPGTGHAAVDAALAQLDGLAGMPTDAHAEVFESVHRTLRDTLSALDDPGPSLP